MRYLLLVFVVALVLSGCQKRVLLTHPVIETQPPKYIWVCDTHIDGVINCKAVARWQDVPTDHSDCVVQDNSVLVCWPTKSNVTTP